MLDQLLCATRILWQSVTYNLSHSGRLAGRPINAQFLITSSAASPHFGQVISLQILFLYSVQSLGFQVSIRIVRMADAQSWTRIRIVKELERTAGSQ